MKNYHKATYKYYLDGQYKHAPSEFKSFPAEIRKTNKSREKENVEQDYHDHFPPLFLFFG